FIGDIWSGIQG
nr:RecName: Full=Venom peptide 5; AltName: Full=BaP-5 [Brotheas amazonicus]